MTGNLRASVSFGFGRENWGEAVDFVIEAEKLGVYSAWFAEAWGSDGISPLAFVAARTSKIMLGTGILQAGSRTPALVGMTAATLQVLTGGRFLLGLGVSGPQVMEGWHGIPFKRPVQRMRETIDIARQVMAGERVAYSGKVYRLPLPGGEGKSIKSSLGAVDPVPIYLATLSPKSLEMTGEIADGWLGTSFMPEHADVFFDYIRAGAQRAGRSLSDIDLRVGGAVAFSDDVESLLPRRRPGIAFTLGAMGSREHNFYNAAFQRAGYEDVAREAQRLWLEGDREGATKLVPDEMVLKTNLLGTDEMVKDRIRAYRDAGVTTIAADPDGRDLGERLDT
ncbi:MAG: LLM class flavin-dependent oxidoreductase, partial [Dehalococcoidia bacterium]